MRSVSDAVKPATTDLLNSEKLIIDDSDTHVRARERAHTNTDARVCVCSTREIKQSTPGLLYQGERRGTLRLFTIIPGTFR